MRCFFCEKLEGDIAFLDKSEHRHLFKILRAEEGKEILLITGKGMIAEAVVAQNQQIKILKRKCYSTPEKRVHLFVAVPRKQKLDILLSQCTEAGVWSIYPIITDRNVAIPQKDNSILKWREKIIEACKQSHNPFFPEICMPLSLTKALDVTKQLKMPVYFGDTAENVNSNIESLPDKGDIAWFVGPEGGFTEQETNFLKDNAVKGLSLGKWIMRVETAALAGVVLLQQ